MKVFTACDILYLPGVKAVWNSIKRNAPDDDLELWCLVYGSEKLESNIAEHGFKTILNPPYPEGTELVCGGWWKPEQMPAMYARILIPRLFPDEERVLWLDADVIVMGSIEELATMDMHGAAVAGILQYRKIGTTWEPPIPNDQAGYGGGVLVIDVQKWNELEVTEKCFDTMSNPPYPGHVPRNVVDGIINYVVTDWHELEKQVWDMNPKRKDPPPKCKIHHWGCVLPWSESNLALKPPCFKDQAKRHWEPYR